MDDAMPAHGAPVFEGDLEIGPADNPGAPATAGLLHAKFARYPGCQQLTVWLPAAGRLGCTSLQVLGPAGRVLDSAALRDRLSGSVQLLFDTLAWPPGEIELRVGHPAGWCHRLRLRKHAGERPPAELQVQAQAEPPPASRAGRGSQPQRYRDGFGRLLPELDLELRRQALASLEAAFTRHLEYEGNFRAGTLTYVEGELRLRFDHEMGAAPCHFYIEVPTPDQWPRRTGTALERREPILRYVAETVRREQCSGWRFEIGDAAIEFY